MNSIFLKIAMIAGATIFCVSSSGQTWTKVGSATPFTDYPTGTSGTATQYRIAIGSTAAASSQLYVLSQAAGLIPMIIQTQGSPTVDIAQFKVGSTSKVVINNSGYMGIGVTTPTTAPLQVYGANTCQALFGSGRTTQQSEVGVGKAYTANGVSVLGYDATANRGYIHVGGVAAGAGISFDANGNTAIGIGNLTTAISEKLVVNGNIKCNSLKIKTWTIDAPDYVFASNYKLRTLEEVEKHINAKKHLPEVPSATEMKANGVDLSTMNMTLLKKVEELTLYAIDQNKKIEAQQKDIQELKTALLGKR